MADKVRVNGNILSWGSITAKVDGEKFYGFTELNFAAKRNRTHVYGMGKHHAPRGRTRGKTVFEEGKLVGPKSTVQALLDKLAGNTGSFGDTEFELVFQFTEEDETPITYVLERCVVTGDSSNHSEGEDHLSDELAINYMAIRRNGKYIYDTSNGL